MNTEEINIRHVWNPETKRWNYSITDTIDFVIQTSDARNYWKVLKNRLKKKGNQLPYNCNQLKMKSRDGKYYLTDATEAKYVLEIMNIISDYPSIPLEAWIKTVEDTQPDKKALNTTDQQKSFPQNKKGFPKESSFRRFCNRLKRFFSI